MSKTTTNNIALDLGAKEFTINNNPDMKVYLNPNDMGIVARIQETVPRMNELESSYMDIYDEDNKEIDADNPDEVIDVLAKKIKTIDAELRECINYIFDYDVCSVIKSSGTLLDIYNGEYAFSIIVTTLLELYSDTITKETNKLVAKMKKRVEKYTAQDHKRKGTK